MPLETLQELQGHLRCPRCGSPLVSLGAGAQQCANTGCDLANDPFPVSGGRPVLIDFEHSLADRAGYLSPTRSSAPPPPAAQSSTAPSSAPVSGRGWTRSLDRWQRPVNDAARENVARLLALLRSAQPWSPRVLVVGGGSVGNGVDQLYADPDVRLTAFDIVASEHCQVVADAHGIPFADGTFDAVLVQAVLEHVLDPTRVVAEIHRVLRPEGLVYAETPFLQAVHEGAYDFHRFTHSGHRWLFRAFDEVDSGAVAGPGASLQWAVDYGVRALTGSRRAGVRSRLLTRPAAVLDRRVPRDRAIDAACAVYFLGRRAAASTLRPRDIATYYAGAQRHM